MKPAAIDWLVILNRLEHTEKFLRLLLEREQNPTLLIDIVNEIADVAQLLDYLRSQSTRKPTTNKTS